MSIRLFIAEYQAMVLGAPASAPAGAIRMSSASGTANRIEAARLACQKGWLWNLMSPELGSRRRTVGC
ncbi:MAG TPA: hypothetical protein VGK29_20170 [Paludibaculum sp.]